jgi:hypothetical protein
MRSSFLAARNGGSSMFNSARKVKVMTKLLKPTCGCQSFISLLVRRGNVLVGSHRNVDLVQVAIEMRTSLHSNTEKLLQGTTNIHHVVFVTLHGKALDGRSGEGRNGIDDTVDGEKGTDMQFSEALHGGVAWFGKDGIVDGGGKTKLVNGGTDSGHDALGADAVEVFVFMVATTKIEGPELAVDRGSRPAMVAEMGIVNGEFLEGGNPKERRKGKFGTEDGMIGNILVVDDDWDDREDSFEFGSMDLGPGDTVEREALE